MKPKPHRKLTITVEDAVYRGLHKIVGRRHMSRFLNDLARPHVVRDRLEEGYWAMAADEVREAEAAQWSEGLVGDVGLSLPSAMNYPGKRAVQRK
jgi:predicted CopG family antitoxin